MNIRLLRVVQLWALAPEVYATAVHTVVLLGFFICIPFSGGLLPLFPDDGQPRQVSPSLVGLTGCVKLLIVCLRLGFLDLFSLPP